MKIALLFRSNCYGGSVRIARFLYDILTEKGHEVTAMSCRKISGGGYFDDVPYTELNIKRYNRDWFYINRFNFFKDAFKDVDTVITTLNPNYPIIPIIAKKIGKKVVISEHGNHLGVRGLKKKLLRFWSYKSADLITFVNQFDLDYFSNFKNTALIRNPILLNLSLNSGKKENIILFPNRLDENKRFWFLLQAFAKIDFELRKAYKIVVCGDGDKKDEYAKFAAQNGINLEITGFVKGIENYYAKAKIVALTSKSEGFANVLIEAIFFDCARISVNCKAGPNEIITDNFNGFLTGENDLNEFANKLKVLITQDEIINKFTKNARLSEDEFAPENIKKAWFEALKRIDI